MRRLLFAAALLATAAPLAAQTVAITGGTVALGDGSEPIVGATVVIQNGKILGAGVGLDDTKFGPDDRNDALLLDVIE